MNKFTIVDGKEKLDVLAELNISTQTLTIEAGFNLGSLFDLFQKNKEYKNKNLYLLSETLGKITLSNCVYENPPILTNNIFYVHSQFIYIGGFIEGGNINNCSEVEIEFKDNKLIMNEELNFNIEDFNVKINNKVIKFENLELFNEQKVESIFVELYEILWISFGFFPEIEKIKISSEGKIIEKHIELLYIYNSSKEHFLRINKIIDLNKIKNWNDLLSNWKKIKEYLGKYPILGLFMCQMKDIRYADFILCILLQSIDGYTEKTYMKEEDLDKNDIIEYLKIKLDEYNSNNEVLKLEFKNSLEYLNKTSFKERLKWFIESPICKKVFKEEIELFIEFNDKKNLCEVFLKENLFLNKCIDERNKLSHMTPKNNLFNEIENKSSYWKLLIAFRLHIIEKLNIIDCIDQETLELCLLEIHNFNIKNSQNCVKCKLNKCLFEKEKIIL